MLSHNGVAGQIDLQEAIFDGDAARDAVQIEEVLHRAHAIHRAHGGLIGYDLEDWLQAERELAQKHQPDQFKVRQTGVAETLPWNQERNCQQCFGLNN